MNNLEQWEKMSWVGGGAQYAKLDPRLIYLINLLSTEKELIIKKKTDQLKLA